jgi:hypothetical protein
MNIFEGSRRIAKLISVCWITGFLIGASLGGFTSFDNGFEFTEFFIGIIGGTIFINLFTRAVGWIVRGFMGIPQNQDSKPEDSLHEHR